MIHINNEFALGDIVSMRTSDSDKKGIVVSITINIDSSVRYTVAWDESNTNYHYSRELTLIEAVETNHE